MQRERKGLSVRERVLEGALEQASVRERALEGELTQANLGNRSAARSNRVAQSKRRAGRDRGRFHAQTRDRTGARRQGRGKRSRLWKSPKAGIASWTSAPGAKGTEVITDTLGPDLYQADHGHSQRRSWRAYWPAHARSSFLSLGGQHATHGVGLLASACMSIGAAQLEAAP